MAFSSGSSALFSSEINVTPLIDVLLVLLIIFMVIVPVLPHGLDSALPQQHSDSTSATTPLTLRILAQTGVLPRYQIDGREATATTLRASLAEALSTRRDRTVFIEADRSLSYGQVAEAVSETKAAGADPVSFLSVHAK